MEYIGTVVATVLISGMYLWFYERLNTKYQTLIEENRKLKDLLDTKEVSKTEKQEMTEEQKQEFEKAKKAFKNLMDYGYEDALRKKE